MNTQEINLSEWNNDNNWSRMGMFGVYLSKVDSRAIVPKATPVLGWTLNFGHRYSILSLVAIVLVPVTIALIIIAL